MKYTMILAFLALLITGASAEAWGTIDAYYGSDSSSTNNNTFFVFFFGGGCGGTEIVKIYAETTELSSQICSVVGVSSDPTPQRMNCTFNMTGWREDVAGYRVCVMTTPNVCSSLIPTKYALSQVATIMGKLASIQSNITATESHLNSVTSSVNNVTTTINNVKSTSEDLQKSLATTSSKATTLEKDIKDVDTTVQAVKQDLTGEISKNKGDLNSLKTNTTSSITGLATSIDAVKSAVDQSNADTKANQAENSDKFNLIFIALVVLGAGILLVGWQAIIKKKGGDRGQPTTPLSPPMQYQPQPQYQSAPVRRAEPVAERRNIRRQNFVSYTRDGTVGLED
jgi:archaellum component FlaC